MRISDAAVASVAALFLAPVLLLLAAVFVIPVALLLVPVISVVVVVGLATLLVLTARSKQPGMDSAPGSDEGAFGRQLPPARVLPAR